VPVFLFMDYEDNVLEKQHRLNRKQNARKKGKPKKRVNKKPFPVDDMKAIAESAAELILDSYSMELVYMEFQREHVGWVMRFYIDKNDGITLDDCSLISRQLNDVLDVKLSQLFQDETESNSNIEFPPYTLEVSSPGIDRPIKKIDDFIRFQGERIQLKLKKPVEGRKRWKGIISDVTSETITIDLEKKTISIPYIFIEVARLDL